MLGLSPWDPGRKTSIISSLCCHRWADNVINPCAAGCWVLSVTDHFYSLLFSAVCDSQSLQAKWKHITSAKRTIIHVTSLGNFFPSVMIVSGHIIFLRGKIHVFGCTCRKHRKCIYQKLVIEACAGYWRWWCVWIVITSRWSVIFALGVAEERPVWAQIIKKLNPIVFIASLCYFSCI